MPAKSTEMILRSIIKHCDEVKKAHLLFNNNRFEFFRNSIYQNAVLFSLLQIGELISHIDTDFKAKHSEIPWNEIKATRNIIVHGYDQLNMGLIWNTSQKDIEDLRCFCVQHVESEIIYKEITHEQLVTLKQSNISFDFKESNRKIIIKYNKANESAINSIINPSENNCKR